MFLLSGFQTLWGLEVLFIRGGNFTEVLVSLCSLLTASVSPRAFGSNLVFLSQHVTTSPPREHTADLLRMGLENSDQIETD